MESVPRLTCERCKKRKIKCDRLSPCSSCRIVNVKCEAVERARRPRGRSGIQKQNKPTLEGRILRIESLLKQVKAQEALITGFEGLTTSTGPRSSIPREKNGDFLAPDFWTELSQEVSGLREAFESSDEEDGVSEATSGRLELQHSDAAVLFGLNPSIETRNICPPPSKMVRSILLDLYKQRVDCLYKILHWPTILSEIEAANADLGNESRSSSSRALEFAIYFMAMCSIRDDEAMELGLGNRIQWIEQYRVATELLVSETNMLRTPTLAALQAFVIYLIGLRAYQNSASAWTLLALAVRVATSLRLGHENKAKFSGFDLELRRRLWYAIALLDVHASFDRGTVPMLRYSDLGPPPLCINDNEMSRELIPQNASFGFTDMSFFEVMFKSMLCHQKLLSMPGNTDQQWKEKIQLVEHYESSMLQSYCLTDETATPLERLARFAAMEIVPSMHLLLRRPPYKLNREAIPAWDEFDVLEMSTTVLERHLDMKVPDFAPWAWKSWVKWHILAVLLAELSSIPPGPDTERHYLVACKSFNSYAHIIADSEWGMLWKPINRLMRRVHKIRGQPQTFDLTVSNSTVPMIPNVLQSPPANIDMTGIDTVPTIFGEFGDCENGKTFASGDDQTTETWYNSEFNWDAFLDETNLSYSTNSSNTTI